MNIKSIAVILTVVILSFSCGTNTSKHDKEDKSLNIHFVNKEAEKQVDVMVGGKLFTTFQWPDNVCKPVLFPICTSSGTMVTRGFPIDPRTGERADHPHQIGMWLTYGNVDGNDFWGNGSQGLGTHNENGGVIKHLSIDKLTDGANEGVLVTSESWIDRYGKELLSEHTEFHFIAGESVRIIDRITVLTAIGKEVSMPDTKEGMFGIRVARQLELPSEGEITLYSADGHPTKVKEMSNEGISGNYRSSEGITGLGVWGTRAKWMDLYGAIDDEKISLVICDHPKNPGYPTYWHARGYGLFAANPFGAIDFTEGKEEVNFSIPEGRSITFRYRFIVKSGADCTDDEINAYVDDFTNKY